LNGAYRAHADIVNRQAAINLATNSEAPGFLVFFKTSAPNGSHLSRCGRLPIFALCSALGTK